MNPTYMDVPQPDNIIDSEPYHLHSCHSRQPWVKSMTAPFPCDCGLTNLIAQEANKARIDELELLGENYPPTNKFQHNLNLYIDARTIALTADKEQADG